MASTTTNVDYYAAGFDSAGRRVCSLICDFNPDSSKNAGKITELLNKVKATSNDVAVAEIITSDYFNAYLGGKVRGSDGNPTDYIPPEPTAEEKKAAERAALETEYNSNKQDMLTALQAALLAGNDDAASSIKQDYKDMTEAYKAAVEEVG
ncbi:hypothetical protein [Megasphaera sp.]|uniref:hypothetical protein n=1 Tax=Megasphaera sp. TaxID=2023260 RepID=UPI003FEE4D08